MNELKRDLLYLQSRTRTLRGDYGNAYARAHLEEIELMLGLCLVQLDYAQLAKEEGR